MTESADKTTAEKTTKASDPTSPDYDPHSPFYDVTADSSSSYYVGPLADEAASGDEIRAGASAGTDLLFNLLGWGDTALNGFKDTFTQRMYEKQLENARHGLDKDLEMRSPGSPPSTVWGNATHEQMVDAISQDADPAVVAESSEEWVRIGNDLANHQRDLAKAINASTANWQGEGGDAAREHLAGVGKWLGSTANGATLSGRQQQIHSQTLNETQKQMAANPPVAFNVQEANANLQTITDPHQYMSQLGKDLETFKKQQDGRDRAAQVMTQFDTTVGSAIATPAFPAPPKLPSAQATPQLRGTAAGGGAGSPAHLLRDRMSPEGADGTPLTPFNTPDGTVAASVDGTPQGGAGGPGGSSNVSPFNAPNGPSGGIPGSGGPGSGGPGSGGPGGGPGGFGGGPGGSPGNVTMPTIGGPNVPGGEGYRPAASSSPTLPNMPKIDDGTHTTGYTPPKSSPSFQPPTLPNFPEGGPRTGGTNFTPPNIPLPNGPTGGGPGPITGPRIPTIGRTGGINGDITGRLGGPPSLPSIPEGGTTKGGPLGGSPKLPNFPGGSGGVGGGSLGGGGVGGGGVGGSGAGAGGLGGAGRSTGALGMGGGVGAGGMDAEGAAGRGGAGSGRAGTAGAMGPMGGMGHGAKGQGDEDKEHKVADYLESDDPSFFAADQVVAPPVIGDWQNKDWK
ncbi:hypothetical protein [Amycolatopsis pittospori]|uniref:hypothetical protein n=1 Tax=Amycolatopsis pittospori TaxID=2749434 RepID=UPI0015F0F48C|nr:hypothetical protein [Amycolatopsis pittospori]